MYQVLRKVDNISLAHPGVTGSPDILGGGECLPDVDQFLVVDGRGFQGHNK
jgi:hypothetical protein